MEMTKQTQLEKLKERIKKNPYFFDDDEFIDESPNFWYGVDMVRVRLLEQIEELENDN